MTKNEEKNTQVRNPNFISSFLVSFDIFQKQRSERINSKISNIAEELLSRKTKVKNQKNQKSKLEAKENQELKEKFGKDNQINVNNKNMKKQINHNIKKEDKTNKIPNNIGRNNNPHHEISKNISNSDSDRKTLNKKEYNIIPVNIKESKRLCDNKKMFYLILFLNIFLPGIGTIIAAIGWKKVSESKNRTRELIIRGIIQIFTIVFIVGWVQAIVDALYCFEIDFD